MGNIGNWGNLCHMIQISSSFGFDKDIVDTILPNQFILNVKTSFEPVVRYGNFHFCDWLCYLINWQFIVSMELWFYVNAVCAWMLEDVFPFLSPFVLLDSIIYVGYPSNLNCTIFFQDYVYVTIMIFFPQSAFLSLFFWVGQEHCFKVMWVTQATKLDMLVLFDNRSG